MSPYDRVEQIVIIDPNCNGFAYLSSGHSTIGFEAFQHKIDQIVGNKVKLYHHLKPMSSRIIIGQIFNQFTVAQLNCFFIIQQSTKS